MNILVDYTYRIEALQDFPVADLATFTLTQEALPDTTEVSISFVDNDEIARLNEAYRGHEGPTDVLSFPCDIDEDDDMPQSSAEPVLVLGDIIIAPDVALAQTETFGTTFEQELSLLLVHGLLHLCGYDHIEDEDALLMQARERALLTAWFTTRGADADIRENPVNYEPIDTHAFLDALSHERGREH